jgi:hypothetical protein
MSHPDFLSPFTDAPLPGPFACRLCGCTSYQLSGEHGYCAVCRDWTVLRRFALIRNIDLTGASGTGLVAVGVEMPDGTVVLRWRGVHRSTVVWDNLHDAIAVHGHDGATVLEWLDH